MGYYDGPPEPEFLGTDTFTCSMEVERQFVTPDMIAALKVLRDGPKILDPWAATRTPEMVAAAIERATARALSDLLQSWRLGEEWQGTCGWEGEADYVVENDTICWDCPRCGEGHSDESARDRWGPDPDDMRKQRLEDAYDQDRKGE